MKVTVSWKFYEKHTIRHQLDYFFLNNCEWADLEMIHSLLPLLNSFGHQMNRSIHNKRFDKSLSYQADAYSSAELLEFCIDFTILQTILFFVNDSLVT